MVNKEELENEIVSLEKEMLNIEEKLVMFEVGSRAFERINEEWLGLFDEKWELKDKLLRVKTKVEVDENTQKEEE